MFQELFQSACPKFIAPSLATYPTSDAMMKRQWDLFKRQVVQQIRLPELRSFLNLYTSVSIPKLAKNMTLSNAEVLSSLITVRTSNLAHPESTSELPISIDENVVRVSLPHHAPTTDVDAGRGAVAVSPHGRLLHPLHY